MKRILGGLVIAAFALSAVACGNPCKKVVDEYCKKLGSQEICDYWKTNDSTAKMFVEGKQTARCELEVKTLESTVEETKKAVQLRVDLIKKGYEREKK